MAYTTNDVAALKQALASGALKVRFADGRETTFRPVREIKEIIADAEAEAAGATRIRRTLAQYDSGV